jgi:hypothetical protein
MIFEGIEILIGIDIDIDIVEEVGVYKGEYKVS